MIKLIIALALIPLILIIIIELLEYIKKKEYGMKKFNIIISVTLIVLSIIIILYINEERNLKNFYSIDEENIYIHPENMTDKTYKEILPYFDEITISDYNYKAHHINTVYGSYTTDHIQISTNIKPDTKKYKNTLLHEYAHHLLESQNLTTPIYDTLIVDGSITTKGEMYTDLLAYKLSQVYLDGKFSGNYVFPIIYHTPLFKKEKQEIENIIKELKSE